MRARRVCPVAVAFFCATLICTPASGAGDATPLSPEEVRRAWRTRLDGKHFGARIRIVMQQGRRDEGTRELEVWRDDRGEGNERLLARFHEPFDLRGVSVVYLEQPGRSNDYFLYQPSAKRVRRVPEDLARQDFYGLDLEFLGFDVAGDEPTEIEELQAVELEGRSCLRLTERARVPNARFERRTVWLDAETFVPMRTEYERGGSVRLLGETLEIRDVQGVPTPVRMRFLRPAEEYVVELHIDEIDYDKPIHDSFFSTVELTKRWYRRRR